MNPHARIFLIALFTISGSVYGACSKGAYSMKNNEVRDTQTNLTWQRCLLGQSGSFCGGEPTLMTRAEAAVAATKQAGWRLPTHDELLTLVQTSCTGQGINSLYFPNQRDGKVWTSSKSDGSGYWTVQFPGGYDDIVNATQLNSVRLVK